MKTFFILLILIIISLSTSMASPLNEEDLKKLQKHSYIEHILYETYLVSDKGPISVLGFHFDSLINKNL